MRDPPSGSDENLVHPLNVLVVEENDEIDSASLEKPLDGEVNRLGNNICSEELPFNLVLEDQLYPSSP